MVETLAKPSSGVWGIDEPATSPYPVLGRIASGIHRLPPGPLGDALRPLTPVQRSIVLAEIIGPPLTMRLPGDELGPVLAQQ